MQSMRIECAQEVFNMKAGYNSGARRRPVNLTLNEDLVVQARGLTDNLSGVVESLLADFVEQERVKRLSHEKTVQATIATWNEFSDKRGSFADDHSTL
jgi:antitoxin CcdA